MPTADELRQIAQWFRMLPEQTSQEILKDIPNCKEYGLVKSWNRLSPAAHDALINAYQCRPKLDEQGEN
jgi:hypothetical protein